MNSHRPRRLRPIKGPNGPADSRARHRPAALVSARAADSRGPVARPQPPGGRAAHRRLHLAGALGTDEAQARGQAGPRIASVRRPISSGIERPWIGLISDPEARFGNSYLTRVLGDSHRALGVIVLLPNNYAARHGRTGPRGPLVVLVSGQCPRPPTTAFFHQWRPRHRSRK